jgi:hypothetical protein
MVKATKADLRYALTTVVDRELKKQQEAEMKEMKEKLYRESYSEYCNYCGKITTINGSDESVRKEQIGDHTYLVGKCRHCGKELYVYVMLAPPRSIFDKPSAIGIFRTKEYVYHLPEVKDEPRPAPRMIGRIWKSP